MLHHNISINNKIRHLLNIYMDQGDERSPFPYDLAVLMNCSDEMIKICNEYDYRYNYKRDFNQSSITETNEIQEEQYNIYNEDLLTDNSSIENDVENDVVNENLECSDTGEDNISEDTNEYIQH